MIKMMHITSALLYSVGESSDWAHIQPESRMNKSPILTGYNGGMGLISIGDSLEIQHGIPAFSTIN